MSTFYANPLAPADDAQLARLALKQKRAIPRQQPGELDHAVINTTSSGLQTLIGGTPGWRICVYQVQYWVGGMSDVDIEWFGNSISLTGPMTNTPAQSGLLLPYTGQPHWKLRHGESLKFSQSVAQQLSGFLLYKVVS